MAFATAGATSGGLLGGRNRTILHPRGHRDLRPDPGLVSPQTPQIRSSANVCNATFNHRFPDSCANARWARTDPIQALAEGEPSTTETSGNIIYLPYSDVTMTPLPDGLVGCYRCGNVWRPRSRARPRVCARCKSRSWDVPKLRRIPRGRGLGLDELVSPFRLEILDAARRRGFSHVRVFGSVRRNQAGRHSDVDFLVDRNASTSLLDRADLIEDLESILGRSVDIVPEDALHWLARPQILFEAVPL